ncbi:hypothetical protein [Sphingomonas sp.]|uniref:hypothetical protein n=1 Tax=Sphingomonas sp. TaxID=28214 RepID=UPI001ED0E246|nr:hypothetical protein [Sphingomonas sp.]MBX3595602.1 hypothetical protein [Sphingomonas sp.]
MRMIGGRDYYDAGAAWGQDESIVFLRNGARALSDIDMFVEIGLPSTSCAGGLVARDAYGARPASGRYRPLRDLAIDGVAYGQKAGQVLFCGTLYRGLRLAREGGGAPRWFWTHAALAAFAGQHGLALHEGEAYAGTARETSNVRRQVVEYPTVELPLRDWFDPLSLAGRAREAVVRAGITIASRDPDAKVPLGPEYAQLPWAVDQPTLGAMDFARAVDPFTAYQEIAMWVGGVLPAPAPGTVDVTDNRVKLEKAGFDHRTSFRRGKGG